MRSLILVRIFSEFSFIFENIIFGKIRGYNRETIRSIIRQILKCDMTAFCENISEIRNV